jgi:steroid delta-isomerase-like uncharacterized protein
MTLRIASLAYPVTGPASFDAFADKFTALVAEGAAGGARLLLMPEYACMEVASAFPGAGDVARELASVCALRPQFLDLFASAARRHGVWLVPGSLPWAEDGRVRNRAPLIAPDGSIKYQDKSVMTRFESERWGVQSGNPPATFETPWGKIGIAICYDSEFPNIVRAQTEAGAWLILVPSCTDTIHGFNRVRLSARARALENQCFVAVAPTVGLAPTLATLDENIGYAAVFGPLDRGFPEDGVIARGVPNTPGWVFADLEQHRIEAIRAEGAVRNFRDWPQPRQKSLERGSMTSEHVVRAYYAAFNAGDFDTMVSYLTEDVAHDINQGGREIGRSAFRAFMAHMDACYTERLEDIVILSEPGGTHAAAEFTVHGTYKATDSGLPEATGQTYTLPAGAFFELRDGQIARVTNFYNLNDWLKQVGAE